MFEQGAVTYRNDFTHLPDIQVRGVAHHRNGTGGESFHVVMFTNLDDPETGDFVATVFEGPGQVAVLATGDIADRVITFGTASWRGDRFEDSLRRAIKDYEESR